jgi:HK97 gp10 family phage protein
VNFRATSEVKFVDLSRVMQRLVPVFASAVREACEEVQVEAQNIVPVDTGDLRNSITVQTVSLEGSTVKGTVAANQPYAAYVEFGTGARGAASAGAGQGPYTESWPGMPAQPYMRPALDTARPAILDAFEKRGLSVS